MDGSLHEPLPLSSKPWSMVFESPFQHAPEGVRTVFLVTTAAACCPLLAGIVLFGWRAAMVAGLSIISCAVMEWLFFFVARTPAMLGRSHAYLTGVLLALTLPAHAPWYVPVVAAAFAIIVGKGVFGGVGHFLWQPALVGRLAVAVMFPAVLASPMPKLPDTAPILAQNHLLVGDLCNYRYVKNYRQWGEQPAPKGADALLVKTPLSILRELTQDPHPEFNRLARVPAEDSVAMAQSSREIRMSWYAKPAAIMQLPLLKDMICGVRPGGIGETSIVVILVAGMYLVYRNYVRPHLPLAFLLAAGLVAAIAPIRLSGLAESPSLPWLWFPVTLEGGDVGMIYVSYQLLSSGIFLAAFFLATEMTTRPVTTGGQVLFGAGCGALAMGLQLYMDTPIPAYMAVLAMNTFVPLIDSMWRPRVLGQRRFGRIFRR